MMELVPKHLRLREYVFNGIPPELEKTLTERERKIIDNVIEECFYFMRGDLLDLFRAGLYGEKDETAVKDSE